MLAAVSGVAVSKGSVNTEYYHAQTEMRPEKLQASPKTTNPKRGDKKS